MVDRTAREVDADETTGNEADASEPTETGHYVYLNDGLNSGPYGDEAAAQAFNDGHLDGEGEVRFVEVDPGSND